MIEIPDLDDIEPSRNGSKSPNQLFNHQDQSGELNRDFDVNYGFSGHKYEKEDDFQNDIADQFNLMSVNNTNEFHIDDDEEEERFKNFQFSSNFEPRNDSNLSNMSYMMKKSANNHINHFNNDISTENTSVQEFNSKASLPISDTSSFEINSQTIELNTARAMHVHQNSLDNNHNLQFKLQDPPVIREKSVLNPDNENFLYLDNIQQVEDNIDEQLPTPDQLNFSNLYNQEELNELQDVVNDIITSPTNISQQFASPISTAQYIKPSPQLPPPMSASSLNRQTLTNGEELVTMRRGLATDLKSPAEYTLHIVFTQFVRHAERKLNLCLDHPIQDEARIIDLLAEGNGDDQFDKIISSLGYIARKKPKPIIDSVMFWRKSKSEVASLAAAEVERVLVSAKSDLSKLNQITPSNPGINKNNVNNGTKSKRSLSLMRSKSLSRITARDHRRNQSASSINVNGSDLHENPESAFSKQKAIYDEQFNQAREAAIQAERKSLASIYILCRVLIEVVKQTSSQVMGDDLGGKLEEIVYTQLKTTDPISTSESLLRSANWNLFAELLGHMSVKRFLSVSDRFIADLEKVPVEIDHEDEPRLHLLIHGMRYLKLTNYPLEVFEESSDFIESLAKFFNKAQNESIILAYCEVLTNLLLPLANILTAETNHPIWAAAIEKIFQKAYFIWNRVNKTIHSNPDKNSTGMINLSPNGSASTTGNISNIWECSINLLTAALSVSSKELFQNTWFEIIEDSTNRLKPKVDIEDRTTFITCIDRVLWVYIFRLSDTLNNTIKRLDSLFQILFFNSAATNKKNQWITSDIYLLNSLVETIRIVGYRHLNYTLDNVIIKLLKLSFNGVSLEGLQPEKLVFILKAYLNILEDYELGKKPEFPTDEALNKRVKQNQTSSSQKNDSSSKVDLNNFSFVAKNSDNALSHEEIIKNYAVLLRLLDSQYGCEIWNKENITGQSTPLSANFSKTQSPFSAFHFGIDFSYQVSKNLNLELFASILEAVPWTMVPLAEKQSPSGIPFKSIVEILTRNSVHGNFRIANASINALRKLATKKNPSSLLNIYSKYAFQFSDKPNPNYDADYLNSNEFHRLLKLYVELLNCWLKQFKELSQAKQSNNFIHPLSQDDEIMSKDVLNDLYQINYKTDDLAVDHSKLKASDELEWKTIITVIEEIEGNGLFFLCSQDSRVRYLGISILKLVEQFDQEIYNATDNAPVAPAGATDSSREHSRSSSKFAADIGTRLIHVLETTDFSELIRPIKHELSAPERNRIAKLRHKKSVLVRIAESDYGIDSTLWFRVYPKLLDMFFDKCPLPVAFCRSIVCVRLVQMHEHILEFSDSYKNYTSSLFSRPSNGLAPEVLVDQWRLYLIFVCCSLTSTNEQKISFPNQPTHGRKKSLQMFIQHQKITSAKSIFRMVISLLKSSQVMVREAVISGLSCININIFKTLLENVQTPLCEWDQGLKKRDQAEDRLRIETIHILSKLTTRFGSHGFIYEDEWMVANLVSIIKSVKNFLSSPQVQTDVDFQKLRRYFAIFLEKSFIGLKDKSDLDRWLPFEARIGCFNYLKEWCGYGDSNDVTNERYDHMFKKYSQTKTSAVAILEVERKHLQTATLSCMATILSGNITQIINLPGNTAVMSFDVPSLMKWVNALLSSDSDIVHDIGKRALGNILKLNADNNLIYNEVVKQCYCVQLNSKTTESYFVTFVNFLVESKQLDTLPGDLLCLSTFLIGDDNYEIRKHSMRLLTYLESKFFNNNSVNVFSEAVTSKNTVVYKKALFEISVHLASLHPDLTFEQISYFTMCFSVVSTNTRRDILSCLLPWVQAVELAYLDKQAVESDPEQLCNKDLNPASTMVLHNLYEITVKFSSIILHEVEALWVALGTKPGNFDKIVEYIIQNSLERKNAGFVGYVRQIVDYLSYSQANLNVMVDKLIDNLQPKSMVPPRPQSLTDSQHLMKDFPYVANLWELIPYNEKDAAFSLGQISLIFLVDLFTTQNDKMIQHLPLLLHISFSLVDHYLPIVQEAACALIAHILHSLALNDPRTQMALNKLSNKDKSKFLWVYDDLNNDNKGARTPKNMDLLVRNCLEILTPIVSNLQDEWSRVALNWSTTCAVRHIACRSFQVFRSLLSFIDQPMLKDMLHRLSNTISDETPDIQGFAMQILMTLNAINAELDSEKLIDFPQLFWSGVACLSTIHEQEFIEVLSAMSKFVSKIDLDSPDTVSCLIATFPPKWEGRFEGLQQVVMVGLRSATSYEQTMKFLDKLDSLQDSDIIGMGDSRLIISIVANLPRFLHSLDLKAISPDIENAAMRLSERSERNGKPSLAKIFISLAKNRFRSKKDFLVQTISSIKNVFFPQYEAQILVLLLGFLSNKTSWIKLESLSTLKYVFPLVDLQREEFIGVGADLISPLLRLLLTDYAEPALEVLDEAVSISGSQMDKDVLRMSLGNSSMKKEYEKTATLFGIPDESGWAIPMPAVTASSTRNNVHAVFSTCSTARIEDELEPINDEDIQFHREDYYVPPNDNASAMDDHKEAASLSHMWAALDDFDSFFTKENDNNPINNTALLASVRRNGPGHAHSASIDTRISATSNAITPLDSAPFVYDKKASVILNRSLARTQSNNSFKASLADSIGNNSYRTPASPMSSKRSYIPFRNSKNPLKQRDNYITPVMPTSPTFEGPSTRITSPGAGMSNLRSNPMLDTPEVGEEYNMNVNTAHMFDNFLGSNKKRTKRQVKPNDRPTSVLATPTQNPTSPSSNKTKDKKKGLKYK